MKIPTLSVFAVGLAAFAAGCGDGSSGRSLPPGIKAYPLKTCIVTGNDLGSMGDEQSIIYESREVKFCCEPCLNKFNKNPKKFLAKIE
jgi:hypothetical protein